MLTERRFPYGMQAEGSGQAGEEGAGEEGASEEEVA
jgi:hypothetical protein